MFHQVLRPIARTRQHHEREPGRVRPGCYVANGFHRVSIDG
jgi:hypothetical protein